MELFFLMPAIECSLKRNILYSCKPTNLKLPGLAIFVCVDRYGTPQFCPFCPAFKCCAIMLVLTFDHKLSAWHLRTIGYSQSYNSVISNWLFFPPFKVQKQSMNRSQSILVISHDFFHFFYVSVFLSLPARLFLSNSPFEPADALSSEIPIPDSQSPPSFCPQWNSVWFWAWPSVQR